MRKWAIGCGSLFVVAVIATGIYRVALNRREAARDEAALQEQFRLARADGIPTSYEEFTRTIKPAKPSENAAPVYVQLNRAKHPLSLPAGIENDLLMRPTSAHTKDAKDYLRSQGGDLALIDKAAALPRCWFNRDWSLGPAVLMPELQTMKTAARLLAFRGSVAVSEGRLPDALRDIHKMETLSVQVREEGTVIPVLVSNGIRANALHHLALWAFMHPEAPVLAKAMEPLLRDWPKSDLQQMNRDELIQLLWLVDASETKEGLAKIGVKPEDTSRLDIIAPLVLSRSKARIDMVKAERRIWAALGGTATKRAKALESAKLSRNMSMMAWPTAARIYMQLAGDVLASGDDPSDQIVEAQRLQYTALRRALGRGRIPKRIDTHDLLSPFDGKPLAYQFDGRQITVTVSISDPDILVRPLKLPSDSELKGK